VSLLVNSWFRYRLLPNDRPPDTETPESSSFVEKGLKMSSQAVSLQQIKH
jgi:hypothetical protein